MLIPYLILYEMLYASYGTPGRDPSLAAQRIRAAEIWVGAMLIWPPISNALTGAQAKEISKSRFPVFPNFLGLVLGCIEAKFCK